SVAWLVEGINIENLQDQLKSEVQCLSADSSSKRKVKIGEKRQRLSARINKFHNTGSQFLKGLEMKDEFIPQDNPTFYQQDIVDEEEEFWEGDDEDWEGFDDEEEQIPPELMGIQMP
ncbi:hypothetical protein SCLCIDRAFT_76068, partial [Scleroderma citrinum Foug A]